MTATAIRMDSARLARAIDLHRYKVPHREGYDMEGLVMSCTRYCAADIAKRFEDPNLHGVDGRRRGGRGSDVGLI